MRRRRPLAACMFVAALALLLLAWPTSALAVPGQLTQLGDPFGCVSESGTVGCADGKALLSTTSVTVSPDGTSAYAASFDSDAVTVFSRNPTTGGLTQLAGTAGCVSETGSGGQCADGKALDGAFSVTVSPDGRSVYVASQESDAVAVFARNTTTGALTQLDGQSGCVSETGSGGACADGKALSSVPSVTVSPDGRSLYTHSGAGAAVFARDTTTGALSQLAGQAGCLANDAGDDCTFIRGPFSGPGSVAVSPDGRSAYIVAGIAVGILTRDSATGALTQLRGAAGCLQHENTAHFCALATGIGNAIAVTVSPDGKSVYVAAQSSSAVAVFQRDTSTGELAQFAGAGGCISETGGGGAECVDGRGLSSANSVAVSPDGGSVYVASLGNAVATFARDPALGRLTQLAGAAGCLRGTGATADCPPAKALLQPTSVAVSPDGGSAYVAALGSSAVAAFAVERPPAPPPPPPPPEPGGVATPTSGKAAVGSLPGRLVIDLSTGKGSAQVPCQNVPADICQISLGLQVRGLVSASAKRKKRRKKRTIKLGSGKGTVPGGKTGTVSFKLSRKGIARLRKARRLRVQAVGSSRNRAGASTPLKKSLTLKAKARKPGKRR